MSLFFHELIHFFTSFFVGYLGMKIFEPNIFFFLTSYAAGFFVDVDHLFDYFFAFGLHFKIGFFFTGKQFLKSDKLYIIFHSFELEIILIFLYLFIQSNPLFLIFFISHITHLISDIFINHMPLKSYFFFYRLKNNFDLKKLVYPDHWQKHLKAKKIVNFD